MTTQPATPFELRNLLTDMIRKDLLGPAGGEEEELDQREDRVSERYLVGMLAPKGSIVEAGELDGIAVSQEDSPEEGHTDAESPPCDSLIPSSLGMTFVVDSHVDQIQVEASWGRYLRLKSDIQKKPDGAQALIWKRQPHKPDPLLIDLSEGPVGPMHPEPDQEVAVQGRIRKRPEGWVVTIFLLNQTEGKSRRFPS